MRSAAWQNRRAISVKPVPVALCGGPPYASRRMKPAPFQYHAPKTIEETLDLLARIRRRRRPRAGRRAKPGADDGVPAGAAEASRRHQRRRRSSTVIEVENGKLCIGAGVRHAAFEKPVEDGPLGAPARDGGAPHRAPSDPHPRHVLRQHRPRRSGLRMVRGRSRARRRDGGREQAQRHARHSGEASSSQGIMTTALQEDELLARGAAADPAEGHATSALPNSAAAPAITPSPWRWRLIG